MKKKKLRTRSKNGTVYWKVTILNTKTGKFTIRKFKKTYDGITKYIHKIRNRKDNYFKSVCAEEMDERGNDTITNGRVLSIDSKADEKMIREASKDLKNLFKDSTLDDDVWDDFQDMYR